MENLKIKPLNFEEVELVSGSGPFLLPIMFAGAGLITGFAARYVHETR